MIEIKNLNKTFEKNEKDCVHAVRDLSVSFSPGITCLIGENGAGKSTLLRLISGVLQKDSGEISIDGLDHLDPKAKANLFFLPDEPFAPDRYTPYEVAKFYEIFYGFDEERFNRLLSKLSLPRDRRISTFSKGMKRQLFLLCAFSVKSNNIILDEAFDGLDPLVLELIHEELIKMTADEGKTIVLSSHNMSSVQAIADSIMILYRGSLSEKGAKTDMGKEFIKYQLASKTPIHEQDIEKEGFEVVSFKKIGSVIQIVFVKQDGIEEKLTQMYSPYFIEQFPLDQSELITLELMLAKKEGGKNE